jgi:membrane protein YqaA with SNARE-associated domain
MSRIVNWVQAFAVSIGGPGLFFIAFLDSSFLSLPEINDLLVVTMVIQNKDRMVYYALMAMLGSTAGCLVLYFVGRKGGEKLIRRRFGGERLERAMALSKRYGVLAVAIPAILPPPAPFKIFVLLAGVAHVPILQFVSAIVAARGLRYFGEAWLAVRYGDQALTLIEENSRILSFGLAVVVIVGIISYLFWINRRRASRLNEIQGG